MCSLVSQEIWAPLLGSHWKSSKSIVHYGTDKHHSEVDSTVASYTGKRWGGSSSKWWEEWGSKREEQRVSGWGARWAAVAWLCSQILSFASVLSQQNSWYRTEESQKAYRSFSPGQVNRSSLIKETSPTASTTIRCSAYLLGKGEEFR